MPVDTSDVFGVPFDLPEGQSSDAASVGDVWVLSADGRETGVVLVAAVRPNHVLAWPITNPSLHATAPAFQIMLPTGERLVVWPDAEFGLSMAALDRRLASAVLNDRTLRSIRWSMPSGEVVEGVQTCPMSESEEAEAAFAAVCLSAWSMGDWSWPNAHEGVGVIRQEVLREAGVEARDLARQLDVKPLRASGLARGEKVPDRDEIARMIQLFPEGTTPMDILRPPDGDEAQVLSMPEFKERIRHLALVRSLNESEARSQVWEAARSNAARQSAHVNQVEAARARVAYAIESLLAGHE